MGKLDRYKINLKNLTEDRLKFQLEISDDFFKELESQDIQGGEITCHVDIRESSGNYLLSIYSTGSVAVSCDRCLDEMQLPVDTTNHLTIKLGPEASDEGSDVITVSEEEGVVDLSWYIYEFIVLSLPIQHIHDKGECNEVMMSELSKHVVSEEIEAKEKSQPETDPRWNALKKIMK